MEAPSDKTKRLRDDSEENSPVLKIARLDSDVNPEPYQLARFYSDGPTLHSPVAGDLQNDLLNILDETDNTTMQGLDSVIKSFEEEIRASGPDSVLPEHVPEPGELHVELGYLLEASDDELGLPPSGTSSEESKPEREELSRVSSDGVDMGELLWVENEFEEHDSVGLGGGANENDGGVVCFDGLLDYPEPSDVLWRSESLQAM